MDTKYNWDRYNKIPFIISIIYIAFSLEALIRYAFDYKKSYLSGNINSLVIGTTILFIIFYGIYSILALNKRLILNNRLIILLEVMALLFIFSVIVIISGGYRSSYKALFIFAIIRATMRKGIKAGIGVSLIASCFILLLNLILQKNYLTSTIFENNIIISAIFVLLACILGYRINIEEKYVTKLKNLVNKDGLTGVYNHRYFYDKLTNIMNTQKLKPKSLSLIFIDIDDFKNYNDLNGHQKGDYVLRTLGNLLKYIVKSKGIITRYGGEEFAIIMENMRENDAVIWAEKIRSYVEEYKFHGEEIQPKGKITVSIGVSEYPGKTKSHTELIKSADDALYRAKFLNKNRVETYVSILDDIKNKVNDVDKDILTSIKTLISVINTKDSCTYAHVERVVMYAKLIANKLNLSVSDKNVLVYGAYMHDIGKINISKNILTKRMPLTDDEWLELKEHPLIGFNIIKDIDVLKQVSYLVLHHHERYDGFGYPNGLKGQEIPYLARILTIIDSFDAMTSKRSYNKCKSYEEGKVELIKCSGSQFDPEIVEKFIDVIDENLTIV